MYIATLRCSLISNKKYCWTEKKKFKIMIYLLNAYFMYLYHFDPLLFDTFKGLLKIDILIYKMVNEKISQYYCLLNVLNNGLKCC